MHSEQATSAAGDASRQSRGVSQAAVHPGQRAMRVHDHLLRDLVRAHDLPVGHSHHRCFRRKVRSRASEHTVATCSGALRAQDAIQVK